MREKRGHASEEGTVKQKVPVNFGSKMCALNFNPIKRCFDDVNSYQVYIDQRVLE